MGLRITLIAFIIGLSFLTLILRQIRRTRISPAAATLWLCVALFLLSVSVFEGVYKWFALHIIGITDARHVIYVAIIGFLMTYVFYLTSVITAMNDQVQNLISCLAILEERVDRLAPRSGNRRDPDRTAAEANFGDDRQSSGRVANG
jgi:hypothetical protein